MTVRSGWYQRRFRRVIHPAADVADGAGGTTMNYRLLSVAAIPATFLGPCSPPTCEPPPPLASILDLEFQCKYPEGVADFTVTNVTAISRYFHAYDGETGQRLGEEGGNDSFFLPANDATIIQLFRQPLPATVLIAPPGLEPGAPGFAAYDEAAITAQQCVIDD